MPRMMGMATSSRLRGMMGCLLTIVMLASCSSIGEHAGLPADSSVPPSVAPTTAINQPLSRRATMRALLARSRANRRGKAPSETLVRVYDSQGNVKSESVKRGNSWDLRPSTISNEFLRPSLSTFLSQGMASLLDTTQTTTAVTLLTAAAANGESIHVIDSVTTEPALISQNGSMDRIEDTSMSYFDVYYNNVTQLGSVTGADGGVAIVAVPGEEEFVEVAMSFFDLHTAALQFVADTTQEFAMGSVRGPHQPRTILNSAGGSGFVNAAFRTRVTFANEGCGATNGARFQHKPAGTVKFVPATVFATTDPCVGQKSALVGSTTTLVVWAIGAAFCLEFCPGALPFIAKGAATSYVATMGAAAATIACVRMTGTGSALRVNSFAQRDRNYDSAPARLMRII